MTAWLDRLAGLRADAGPSDANYQWQANKHAAETYIGFDGCPEFLAAAANLWPLLVATVQAAETVDDEHEAGLPAALGSAERLRDALVALRAEVEKLP